MRRRLLCVRVAILDDGCVRSSNLDTATQMVAHNNAGFEEKDTHKKKQEQIYGQRGIISMHLCVRALYI